jgi:hypothetical protein
VLRPPDFGSPLFSMDVMGELLAYLDPGAGSMVLQAVVGGVAAVAVMGKLYWRQFLTFIGVRKKDDR